MRTLRNVFRRKLRVLLTIFGITIGVLALVVMGSMAEKINMLVSGGTEYYSDKVTVGAEGTSLFSDAPLSLEQVRRHQERARGGRGLGQHRHLARHRDLRVLRYAPDDLRQRPARHRIWRASR